MNKLELRNLITNRLKSISVSEREIIEQKQFNYLVASDVWKQANSIGITISREPEWSTKSIIEAAWSQGKLVSVPKCFPTEKKLIFYELESYDQLEVVYYNLLEPKQGKTHAMDKDLIDLLVVPGLVFNNQGYRIGFGGGYYDRFLKDFQNKTIALASTIQLVAKLPIESFDVPIENIITEHGFLK